MTNESHPEWHAGNKSAAITTEMTGKGDTANIAKWIEWQGMTSLKYVDSALVAGAVRWVFFVAQGVLAHRAWVLQPDGIVD